MPAPAPHWSSTDETNLRELMARKAAYDNDRSTRLNGALKLAFRDLNTAMVPRPAGCGYTLDEIVTALSSHANAVHTALYPYLTCPELAER